jgi:hypothetical protein
MHTVKKNKLSGQCVFLEFFSFSAPSSMKIEQTIDIAKWIKDEREKCDVTVTA